MPGTELRLVRPPGTWSTMHRVATVPARSVPSQGSLNAKRLALRTRNHRLVDLWSATHFAWGVGLTMLVGPAWAFGLLVAWEPIEVLLLGPLLSRRGIAFGHEGWRNSLSDIVFDGLGVLAACGVLLFWDPLGLL